MALSVLAGANRRDANRRGGVVAGDGTRTSTGAGRGLQIGNRTSKIGNLQHSATPGAVKRTRRRSHTKTLNSAGRNALYIWSARGWEASSSTT